MNTERRGQRNQKGRAGAKPRQGLTWTLHLHCCLGRPGQTLRGPGWPEGLGKPGSGQVSIQSWDGDASILHPSHELGKSMHPPQGAGGNALPLNAALPPPAYLRALGTRLPSAPSYCRRHFQFLLSVYFITATANPPELGSGHHGSLSRLCCSSIGLVKDFTTYSMQTSSWADRPLTSPFALEPPISFIKCHLGRTSCPLSSEPLKAGTHTCSTCNMTKSSTKQLAQRHVGGF